MRKIVLFAITATFIVLSQKSIGQDFTIASEDYTGCVASLNDTNPIGQYSDNEDETLTICPDDGETILNMYWIGFDVGSGDVLEIFDGADINAPLIGTYTGSDLLYQNITSTNPLGCLTLHWTSDGEEVGDFAAIISCGPPCQHPIVQGEIVGDEGNPLLLCVGEEFTIDASTTVLFEGASVESQTWDFDDGNTDNSNWPVVTHSYNTPGAYRVSLVVTDNTGCQNLNLLDQLIYVSTTPSFTSSSTPPMICENSDAVVGGNVIPTPFTNQPTTDFGDGVYIPDYEFGQESCFEDTVFVSGFPAGLEIQSPADIDGLFASLEHTYLTDITIAFICPNGSVLSIYSQQGPCGDVDLGNPDPLDDGAPGEGIMYTWTPETTYPTFAEACSDANYTFDGTDSGLNLVEGEYNIEGDWNSFVGCPLNGPWIIQICDIVGADDGWIFEWGVEFDPSLYDDDMSFTPVFDVDCEFTSWSGDDIINTDAGCDTITVSPSPAGLYTYTYTATDNFGCTYTHTQDLIVVPPPVVEAEDVALCVSPVSMDASVSNPQTGIQYGYIWSPDNGTLSNINVQNPLLSNLDAPTQYQVTAFATFDPQCLGTATIDATLLEAPDVETTEEFAYFCGIPLEVSAEVLDSDPDITYTYNWQPANGLDDEDTNTPTVNSISSDPYELVVFAYPSWDNLCISSDTMFLTIPPGPEVFSAGLDSMCVGSDYYLEAPSQSMSVQYDWSYAPFEDPTDFNSIGSGNPILVNDGGIYSATVTESICGLTTNFEFVLLENLCSFVIPNVFTPNGDSENDTFEILGLNDFPNSTIKIYNRWGNLIYEEDNYYDQWRGDDMAEGTYYYIVGVKNGVGPDGYEYFEGHLTLLRE
ncbi:MAG: gliding motility-associated C-terminal domain-containing protein [Flavobacteriales bacterium]